MSSTKNCPVERPAKSFCHAHVPLFGDRSDTGTGILPLAFLQTLLLWQGRWCWLVVICKKRKCDCSPPIAKSHARCGCPLKECRSLVLPLENKAHVRARSGMGERADGNIVHADFSHRAHALKIHIAAGFGFNFGRNHRHGFFKHFII